MQDVSTHTHTVSALSTGLMKFHELIVTSMPTKPLYIHVLYVHTSVMRFG